MKFKITLLLIIFITLGVYYLIHNGYYPVALVNGKLISARLYEKEFRAALIYYRNAMRTYAREDLDLKKYADFVEELRRAALHNLRYILDSMKP